MPNVKTIAVTAVIAVLAVVVADYLGVTATVRGLLPAKTP